ncbi:hypothetical protein [Kribbella sp. NPDC051718]|uniref:hypothetical protein n=1 Tax=Kribbella sp. NPDC051718 TaxID=3155168 RepID=UPI0034336195
MLQLTRLSLESIRDANALSLAVFGAVLSLLLIFVPLSAGLFGALRAAYRTLIPMIRRRPVAVQAGT